MRTAAPPTTVEGRRVTPCVEAPCRGARAGFSRCAASGVLLFAAASSTGAREAATRLPEFFVTGARVASSALTVPRDELRMPEPNLGPELLTVPGVTGHTRATDAFEPAIRGLGFDRVATTLNGIPLLNASPERTYSPVAMLGGTTVTSIEVVKALPSVTLGPPRTGGAIRLDAAAGLFQSSVPQMRTTLSYHGGRDGFSSRASGAISSGRFAATFGAFHNDLGDYTAADGRRVAATLRDHGTAASVGVRHGAHALHASFASRRLQEQSSVSLPLDGMNSGMTFSSLAYAWRGETSLLRALDLRLGYASADPFITSRARTSPLLTEASSTARSLGAGFMATLGRDNHAVRTGFDFTRQYRRAVRRTPTAVDHIWPGVTAHDAGVFAEWTHQQAAGTHLRAGVRLDHARSDAADADRPALGRSLREQFVRYNGPAAARTRRSDTTLAANVLVDHSLGNGLSLYAGVGLSSQPPQVMERYRAFLNALGGDGRGGAAFELGNPALRTEQKYAAEAGAVWSSERVRVEGSAFSYRIDDFVVRVPVGQTPGPGVAAVVFGYRNRPVMLHGGELAATLLPHPGLSIPLTFGAVRGFDRDSRRGLPDLAPWEATGAVRVHSPGGASRFAAEAGARVVGRKQNPAPLDNPLFGTTGGFVVVHVRLGWSPTDRLRFEAGIENVLNRRYTEYLTPPVAPVRPATGDLKPGERVPAMGRAGWVALTFRL